MLHGRGGSPRLAAHKYYGSWQNLADKEKFAVVFPGALGRPDFWKCWGGKRSEDAIFLSDLIKQLRKEYKIDANRVFMTGHSSGGYMSYCFGAAFPEHVAAIGPMAGLMVDQFGPKIPVSVISIHGMADKIVAYDRKNGAKAKHSGRRSAPESAKFFASHNGCKEKTRKTIKDGWVHIDTWPKGKGKTEVVLYSLKGGDHGWPKAGSRSIDATKVIWEFFKNTRVRQRRSRNKKQEPQRTDQSQFLRRGLSSGLRAFSCHSIGAFASPSSASSSCGAFLRLSASLKISTKRSVASLLFDSTLRSD